ncbi:hypothetical protein KHA80_05485 [Anaerobacillus sp. HL2]|nr:hypothetical protein KHA80_05485 [Anaerobacillus sp. HL2]
MLLLVVTKATVKILYYIPRSIRGHSGRTIKKTINEAEFSSVGDELDIVAPGVNIVSTTNDGNYGILSTAHLWQYHITGAIATLWASKSLSSDEIKRIIYQSATPLGRLYPIMVVG